MRTVITHLLGGLGNQMFQYAAGLAAAQRNNAVLRIDCRDFSWYRRPYALDSFRISAQNSSRWDRLYLIALKAFGNKTVIRHDSEMYRHDPTLLDMQSQRKIILLGHWQNENYFTAVRERLLDEFRLHDKLSALDTLLGQTILNSESVAIHIRRGDNIGKPDPANPSHMVPQPGMVSESYVANAMQYILKRAPAAQFIVFSDESSWVKKHFRFPLPVSIVETYNDVQQFELMSRCKHHIIANSTYSWWAAWLNNNSEKIVCAPKNWDIRNPDYDTTGLLPASWTQL